MATWKLKADARDVRERRHQSGCPLLLSPARYKGRAEEGLGHRGGAKRRSEPPKVGTCGNSDPLIEADAPSTGSCSCTLNGVCAAPGEDIVGDVQWSRHELIYSSFLGELLWEGTICQEPTWRLCIMAERNSCSALRAMLRFALSRGAHTLFGGSVHMMRSVLIRTKGAAIFRSISAS